MLIALLSLAWAQAPSAPSGLQPLMPMPGLSMRASADARWFVADTASVRFPGETVAGPAFTAGTEVEVIVTEGDQVRVHKDERYGWVPAAALTATAPTPTMPTSSGLLGMPPLLPPKP
jgi:hypothetical protein